MVRYRIWNHCRRIWWRPDGKGYTYDIAEAGIYEDDDARAIHGRDHRSGCNCRRESLADEKIPAPDHSSRPERQRRGKTYPYHGEDLTLRELYDLAREHGTDISMNALWHRLEISEWSVHAAITTPRADSRAKAEEVSR